ncbi:transcription repressor OFP4 isoform X1 [Cucurbita pepo subsp. pepo]|uniref:transcription repressor OFP4-like n=1 Tax=Cucurbita pepo subsp. pepo TaxID=3664 RepID=UPI000C9D9C33|nr:transcription repressor OFP4-like [Cucurbita pepo subsp. pepo]XP_023522303.1 transcription repressor OFP4-like [Cucurbita pepo subsp. pepo]XP_023523562.1 transcription repressor OFP4 isoform X1 [Cucurbita pepo subsp. pepo]
MGKYKFRLSGMIPNAWFYKLKDMGSNRSKHNSSQSQSSSKKNLKSRTMSQQKPHVLQPFYFTEFIPKLRGLDNSPVNQNFSGTHFPDPARKSSKRRSRRKTIYKPSPRVVNPVSATCICHISPNSVGTLLRSPDSSFSSIECSPGTEAYESSLSEAEGANTFSSDSFDDVASWSSSCKCTVRSSNNDIIIDMNDELVGRKTEKLHLHESNWVREMNQLPPILRKPMSIKQKASKAANLRSSSKWKEIQENQSLYVKTEEENIRNVEKLKTSFVARKSSASSISVKLRANSPRIARRRIQGHARRSLSSRSELKSKNSCLSESIAMVKTSHNPQEDFRESMVEMIIENNIRSSKDLEDLLACYLILNSDEYHNLIIKTFEQIWVDMAELHI